MTTRPATPAARQLAEWALGLRLADVGVATLERVKLHFLDQIGAQASCRNMPTPRIVNDYVAKFGVPGKASIIGTTQRADPEYAAFANSTSGSAFEIDDYGGKGAYAHPGCVVVPVALAVAEHVGASGADLLRALAVGFETVIRLAIATMPSLLLERGFHQTGSHGVFAAALETAMLEGDDVATAVNAMAIGGSHASATTEYGQSGGEVKRVHGGIGAAGGIRAARLARMGLSGPPTILEGKRGFLQAFCNAHDARPLTEDLGSRWHFPERGAIKPYASCGLLHDHFAAYDKLRAAHRFTADDVEHVVLGCSPLARVHTGAIGPHPKDVVSAQFSAEYSVAMRIVTGRNDVGSYLDAEAAGFRPDRVTALAERVRMEVDPACSEPIPMGRVTLALRDGRTLSELGYALGTPMNPFSRADIEQKYRDLVERDFGRAIADRSIELVMNIEQVKDVGELTRLFEPR